MAICSTIVASDNLFNVTVINSSVDTFMSLYINGELCDYFTIMRHMYPRNVFDTSEKLQKIKRNAYGRPGLEMEYINYLYQKQVISKKHINYVVEQVSSSSLNQS